MERPLQNGAGLAEGGFVFLHAMPALHATRRYAAMRCDDIVPSLAAPGCVRITHPGTTPGTPNPKLRCTFHRGRDIFIVVIITRYVQVSSQQPSSGPVGLYHQPRLFRGSSSTKRGKFQLPASRYPAYGMKAGSLRVRT